MLLNCGVGEDSWEYLGLQRNCKSFWRISVLGVHWKDWCWSWNSNILATWCEQLTHLKRPWCWERLKAGEGGDKGWDGWMASLTDGHEFEWTPGVGDGPGGLVCCNSWGRKESDTTEQQNWTDTYIYYLVISANNAETSWGLNRRKSSCHVDYIPILSFQVFSHYWQNSVPRAYRTEVFSCQQSFWVSLNYKKLPSLHSQMALSQGSLFLVGQQKTPISVCYEDVI